MTRLPAPKRPKRNKYNAKKTIVDGIKFDSKKEAKRYQELNLLQRAGEIHHLKLQVPFVLMEGFREKITNKKIRDIKYIADFTYYEKDMVTMIIEDSKGVRTDVFNIKHKMLLKMINDDPNIIFKLT